MSSSLECKECYDPVVKGSEYCLECKGYAELHDKFKAFAESAGLDYYPRIDGERYLCSVNPDKCDGGKKSELIFFMDDLWNALVEAKGGDDELLIGEVQS